MEVKKFEISGPLLIKNKCFSDNRGFFTERYKANEFSQLGLPQFIQDNYSISAPNVLRGLHYQWDQPQGKLVTCLQGHIIDIIVDIRATSSTYGEQISVELKGDEPTWFWVPPGFAHGFLVLGDQHAAVMYKVDSYWNGKTEGAILWNDNDLALNWPTKSPSLSPKDEVAQSFATYKLDPKFQF